MKLALGSSLLVFTSAGHAVVISVMAPQTYNAALPAGNGHSPTFGTAYVSIPAPDINDTVLRLNSITIHGWQAVNPGRTEVYLSGTSAFQYLHFAGGGNGQVNGDITFKPETVQNSFTSRVISIGAGTIGSGNFTPRGKSSNPTTNFNAHAGSQAGWALTFTNISEQWGGSFQGVSIDVDLAPVPEPGSLLVVGTGLLGLVHRRRRIRQLTM